MKKYINPFRVSFTILMLAVVLVPLLRASGDEPKDLGTQQTPTAAKWGGIKWKTAERSLFQGRPQMTNDANTTDFVTVAYGRYVSYYDVKHFTPRWVAYVTDRASWKNTTNKSRAGSDFDRPGGFFTDAVIADASADVDVEPVEHDDYGDMVPEGATGADVVSKTLPPKKASAQKGIIERGHLASNNTMKTWGNEAEGKKAQEESFSLANVVAELKAHNAPTWSALEKQCLVWANELGTVSVVTGPIYNDLTHARHIQERTTDEESRIPFPDALFCVVIGKRAGEVSAIGFIMPHQTAKYKWDTKAVPIDDIEKKTGINFMPALGEPNPLEQSVDPKWLNN